MRPYTCAGLSQGWFAYETRSPSRRRTGVCRRWLHFSCTVSTTRCSFLRCSASSTPPAPFTRRRTRRLCRPAYSTTLGSGQELGHKIIQYVFHSMRTVFESFALLVDSSIFFRTGTRGVTTLSPSAFVRAQQKHGHMASLWPCWRDVPYRQKDRTSQWCKFNDDYYMWGYWLYIWKIFSYFSPHNKI